MSTVQTNMLLDLAATLNDQLFRLEWFNERQYGEYMSKAQDFLQSHTHILEIRNKIKGQVSDNYMGITQFFNVFRTEEEQDQHILKLFENNPSLMEDLQKFSVLIEDCLDTATYYWNL